jgi:hypothetical protein
MRTARAIDRPWTEPRDAADPTASFPRPARVLPTPNLPARFAARAAA